MRFLPHRPFPLRAVFGILGASLHEHDPLAAVHDNATSAISSSVTGSDLQDNTEKCSQH